MHNFFVASDSERDGRYYIDGDNFTHISNVLRMKSGEEIYVSCCGKTDLCALSEFTDSFVIADIIKEDCSYTELPCEIYLFQGLPKADKLEMIIQKAVELGVHSVIPVEMKRSVVKLDDKKKRSKTERWQAISESAAKQSKRNRIPEIFSPVCYSQAIELMSDMDVVIVPYENEKGVSSLRDALGKIYKGSRIAVLIGPEGGFEDSEICKARDIGADIVSLGKRILRTETAAITTVATCMLHIEMSE